MSFGTPTALFWLALAGVIVGLYILKVRLRRVPVSTNLFWKQIYEEKPPRSLWQYLRHLLSLLLQLLLLGLLVFAVADPYLPWQLTQARRIVLVVDRSASMQSTDVLPTRFAAAMEAVHTYVDGLRAGDEMAIILADARPEVAVGMNSHIPTLQRVVGSLVPTDGPTHLEPAIELARKLIGAHPKGQVIVLTDGCVEESADSNPVVTEVGLDDGKQKQQAGNQDQDTNTAVAIDSEISDLRSQFSPTFRIFATAAANVGITQFQVRRSLVDPLGYEVLAEVKNASPEPLRCRLELELDGLPVDILPLDLAPDEVWSRSIEKTSLEGGRLSARLTEIASGSDDRDPRADIQVSQPASLNPQPSANHLLGDDVAWAILPSREIQQVLVVTPGNLFLQKVFEANPLVAVTVLRELPDAWPSDALIVLHQLVPERLPTGDVFVVDPGASTDLWTLGETLANPIVTEQDKDSPLMTHVRLDNVLMPQARKIEPTGQTHVLAGSLSGDPIYAEFLRDSGECLVLTVNLDEGDLAFRTAFPIMVSNALGWFAGTSGELNRSLSTGVVESVTLDLSTQPPMTPLRLKRPDGESEKIAIVADVRDEQTADDPSTVQGNEIPDKATVGPLQQVGVYEVTAQPEDDTEPSPLATIAVNLANRRETDLRPTADMVDTGGDTVVAGWFSRPVWYYLAALAALLTLVEWFLYQRRMIE